MRWRTWSPPQPATLGVKGLRLNCAEDDRHLVERGGVDRVANWRWTGKRAGSKLVSDAGKPSRARGVEPLSRMKAQATKRGAEHDLPKQLAAAGIDEALALKQRAKVPPACTSRPGPAGRRLCADSDWARAIGRRGARAWAGAGGWPGLHGGLPPRDTDHAALPGQRAGGARSPSGSARLVPESAGQSAVASGGVARARRGSGLEPVLHGRA